MWNRGENTKCVKCPEPELLDENKEAFSLFSMAITQFRHGFGGPTGLIYSEVGLIAKLHKIDFKKAFGAVRVMEGEYLAIVQEQQSKNSESAK